MLIDENVINFKQLLTDQRYFTTKATEAFQLLVAAAQQQQLSAASGAPVTTQ
jgi:hypothetical protein